jgi:hypothetical protein
MECQPDFIPAVMTMRHGLSGARDPRPAASKPDGQKAGMKDGNQESKSAGHPASHPSGRRPGVWASRPAGNLSGKQDDWIS